MSKLFLFSLATWVLTALILAKAYGYENEFLAREKRAETPNNDLDVVFVLDESASLAIKKYNRMLDFLTAIAHEIIKERKGSNLRLGVVGFAHFITERLFLSDSVTLPNFVRVMKFKKAHREKNLDRKAVLGTNIRLGMVEAVKLFEASNVPNQERLRIAILVTDGKISVGNTKGFLPDVDAFNRKWENRRSQIRTIAIGVGEEVDSRYLRELGMVEAVKLFEASNVPNQERPRIAILFTDGKISVGNTKEFLPDVDAFNAKWENRRSQIRTIAIGVGEEVDTRYLRENSDVYFEAKNFGKVNRKLLHKVVEALHPTGPN